MSSQDKSNPSIDYRPDEFYLQDDSPSYFTPSRKPWDTNTRKAQQSQIKPLATDASLSTQYPQHGGPSVIPQSQSQYSNSSQPVQHRVRAKRSTSSQFNSPAKSNYNHKNIISNPSSNVMASNSSNNYPTISSNVEAASAVMAQEMNAIKALKRLSIGALPTLDPDLPNYSSELYRHSSDPTSSLNPNLTVMHQNRPNSTSFDGFDFSSQPNSESLVSSVSSDSENISFDSTEIDASHASQLLWVPATVHPELAPQEWKTFVQNKIAEIKAAYSDSVKVDDQSNSTGQSSHINRRNSRLSRQIRDQESYTDGADILEKRKSRDILNEQLTDPTIKSLSNQIKSLGDLENLANDPLQLARSLSMNTDLYSYYSKPSSLGHKSESQSSANQISNDSDSPILPAPTSSLRRSTNTRYNKSSIRRGRKDTNESPSLKKILPEKSAAKATSEPSTVISESFQNTNTLPWVTVSAGLPRKIQIPIIGKTLDECPYIGEDPLASNPQTRILLENDFDNIPDIKTYKPSNTKPDVYNDSPQPVEIAPSKEPTEKTHGHFHSDKTQRENVINNSQSNESKTLPMKASESLQKEPDVTPNYSTTPTEPLIKNDGQELQDLDPQVQNPNKYEGQAGDEDSYGNGKNRKGTWGWLFSGSNPNQSPNSDTTVQNINKEENDSGTIQSQDKPIRSSTTQNQPSKPSASPPISKDRITNFFSKKKSSASLRDQKLAEKQADNTPTGDSKSTEVDVKDSSKYLLVENVPNKKSRSPSPNLESQSDEKSKDQSKQRGRYRSRTKSPDKRKPDDQTAKNDSDNTSISSGQNITAKPMSEGAIVAYSPEAAAYYGAPYQIPPHQMSDKSLIMMHHRYPLHIERAIYRLSHIKLANAKRPLAQQVLLSNFMYAYLNLINQGFIQQQQQAQMQLQMQLEQQQKQQQLYQNQYSYEVQQNATNITQGDNSNNDPRNLRYEQYNNYNNPQH